MKILIISHEYPPVGGGGANACKFLSREFIKKGNRTVLVTAGFEGLKERENEEGLSIHRLRCKRKHKEHCSFGEMADFVNKAIPCCDRLVREESFDICLIFFGIPSGVVGRYLKSRYRLPYVIRFGGGDIPGFQERFKLIYKFIGPFVKDIWKNASALVANSEGLKKFALRFCDRYPIEVIPNGVDTESFGIDERTPAPENTVRLLFVSRLIERKGLQLLIPHLKDIENTCGKRVTLTVVGDGPYRQTLEAMAAEYGASDMVTFEGQKDKAEIPEYFKNADIFVFPSKREGMPNAVLEAMAGSLPVVMTPCEGSDELIAMDGEKKNGIIARGEFYKAVTELISSGSYDRMGQNGRRRAEALFSWESTAARYLELF